MRLEHLKQVIVNDIYFQLQTKLIESYKILVQAIQLNVILFFSKI
jgi:hypothetical protein